MPVYAGTSDISQTYWKRRREGLDQRRQCQCVSDSLPAYRLQIIPAKNRALHCTWSLGTGDCEFFLQRHVSVMPRFLLSQVLLHIECQALLHWNLFTDVHLPYCPGTVNLFLSLKVYAEILKANLERPFTLGHSFPGPVHLDLSWTKWKWDRFFSVCFGFTWGVQVLRYPNFFLGNGSR